MKLEYGYGMVSGDAFRGTLISLSLLYFMFRDYKVRNILVQTSSYIVVTLLSLQIGYIKMMDGHHTLDQVFAGFFLAIVIHILVCHTFREHLDNLWNDLPCHNISYITNSIVLVIVSLNAAAIAAVYHHEANFDVNSTWKELTDLHIGYLKTETAIQLFASANLLGAYLGFLLQIGLAKWNEGKYIEMDKLDNYTFLQTSFRISLVLILSFLSLIPWNIGAMQEDVVHKVLLQSIAYRFVSAFAVFAFFRKIDTIVHPEEEFVHYQLSETSDSEDN